MIYAIIILGLVILAKWYFKPDYEDDFWYGLIIILLSFMILIGGLVYLKTIGEVAEMEAFYDNTLSVYEYTVDKSENINIYAVKDAENEMTTLFNAGNLAYFELAKSVNANLVELRESIKTYNTRLYSYRKYNAFWLTDGFFCNVPEYLKPINIK